jgi:flagellar basal-body rod protein FlgC
MVGGKAGPKDFGGVQVMGMEPNGSGFRRVHEPKHPHADAEGFVSYPDIDHAGEMTLMIKTSRAYEANLTAMNIAHQMYARALELGRQS